MSNDWYNEPFRTRAIPERAEMVDPAPVAPHIQYQNEAARREPEVVRELERLHQMYGRIGAQLSELESRLEASVLRAATETGEGKRQEGPRPATELGKKLDSFVSGFASISERIASITARLEV